MAGLTAAQKKELKTLSVKCLDDNGNPLADATDKDLARLQTLIDKATPPAASNPTHKPTAKGHKLSEAGKRFIENSSGQIEYLGCTSRMQAKRTVIDEYFYAEVPSPLIPGQIERRAFVVKDGNDPLDVGRTFGEELLRKLQQ